MRARRERRQLGGCAAHRGIRIGVPALPQKAHAGKGVVHASAAHVFSGKRRFEVILKWGCAFAHVMQQTASSPMPRSVSGRQAAAISAVPRQWASTDCRSAPPSAVFRMCAQNKKRPPFRHKCTIIFHFRQYPLRRKKGKFMHFQQMVEIKKRQSPLLRTRIHTRRQGPFGE